MAHAMERDGADMAEVMAEVNGWPIQGDRYTPRRFDRQAIGPREYRRGYSKVYKNFEKLREIGLLKVDNTLTKKGAELAKELRLGQGA